MEEGAVSALSTIMSELGTFMGTAGASGSGMLNIWQSVVGFVTTEGNAICRLGIYAWLFVMGVGGIRKLITGV